MYFHKLKSGLTTKLPTIIFLIRTMFSRFFCSWILYYHVYFPRIIITHFEFAKSCFRSLRHQLLAKKLLILINKILQNNMTFHSIILLKYTRVIIIKISNTCVLDWLNLLSWRTKDGDLKKTLCHGVVQGSLQCGHVGKGRAFYGATTAWCKTTMAWQLFRP